MWTHLCREESLDTTRLRSAVWLLRVRGRGYVLRILTGGLAQGDFFGLCQAGGALMADDTTQHRKLGARAAHELRPWPPVGNGDEPETGVVGFP
jgi:hypothetical protein